MFKCYLTGIELKEEEAFVLDIGAARRAIKKLKDKTFALERLIQELGQIDKVEIRNRKGKSIRQNRRRLISHNLAEAYSKTYPEDNIFVRWRDWITKMRSKAPAENSPDANCGHRHAEFNQALAVRRSAGV